MRCGRVARGVLWPGVMHFSRSLCAAWFCVLSSCGNSTARVHDIASDDTIRQRVSTTPTAVELTYDGEGRLQTIERNGARTSIAYGPLLRTVTDPRGGTTPSTFTPNGAPGQVVDARGVVTEFERDGFAAVTAIRSADTGLTQKTYDEAGNLKTLTDARGVTSTLTFDALNRLTRVVHRGGSVPEEDVFTWVYDGDGGAAGQLVGTTFPGGRTERAFDESGALVRVEQQVGTVSTVTAYDRDALGRIVGVRYPSRRRLSIQWGEGSPVAISLGDEDAGVVLVDGIVSRGGDIERMTWHLSTGPRVQQRHSDAAGRVVQYPLGEGTRSLRFDASGRVAGFVHHGPEAQPAAGTAVVANASDETFSYDGLDRLVGYTRAAASYQVRFDETSNRLALEGEGTARGWQVEPNSNRLADAGAFDPTGNLLGDGTFTATYDLAGRLASFDRQGVRVSYLSDGDGYRVRKASGANELIFVWDAAGHLLGEYDETGAPVREYVWLGDHLVGFFLGAEFFFVQVDHLGAPRTAIDLEGRVRWTWLVNPFGDGVPSPVPVEGAAALGLFDLPLRFPGQYADVESGFFHNHYRDYDPMTGRYLQADPLGLEGGINPYAYVGGDPINAIDPDGLAKMNLFWPLPGDRVLYDLAERDADIPGMLTIHGHGSPNSMLDERSGQALDALALAQRIRDSGLWKPGMFVRLVACNVGQGGKDSLVWKLAHELGTPVTGPDSLIQDFVKEEYWYPTNHPTPDGPSGHHAAGRFVTVVPGRSRR